MGPSRRTTRRNKPQIQLGMILVAQTKGRARPCMPATSGARTRNSPADPRIATATDSPAVAPVFFAANHTATPHTQTRASHIPLLREGSLVPGSTLSRCIFPFVVVLHCVRAGARTMWAVCEPVRSHGFNSAIVVSIVRAKAISFCIHCTTELLHQNIRSQRCGLLRRKRARPRDCQLLWTMRGSAGVFRVRAWACAAYCLLIEYHILLGLGVVTPCCAPTSVPCLCNIKREVLCHGCVFDVPYSGHVLI